MNNLSLLTDIENAFRGVTLGKGFGLHQARALEDFGSPEDIARARQEDRANWRKWEIMPDEAIEQRADALCFVDAHGFKFLLPAYMRYTVRNYRYSAAAIDSAIYALARDPAELEGWSDDLLTNAQKDAIARFLRWVVTDVGDTYLDAPAASQALEAHWCPTPDLRYPKPHRDGRGE